MTVEMLLSYYRMTSIFDQVTIIVGENRKTIGADGCAEMCWKIAPLHMCEVECFGILGGDLVIKAKEESK